MQQWIWQSEAWPNFVWDNDEVNPLLVCIEKNKLSYLAKPAPPLMKTKI